MNYIIHYSIRPANKFAISTLDRLRISYTVAHGYRTEPVSYTHLDVYKRQPTEAGRRSARHRTASQRLTRSGTEATGMTGRQGCIICRAGIMIR